MLGLTYFKRFRMETDLDRDWGEAPLAAGYRLVPWRGELLHPHAEAKYLSFRSSVDANVFPCLGEHDGCVRLMREISHKDGFLPEATWLAVHVGTGPAGRTQEFCGTIQGIRDRAGMGAIQNLGVTPEHRGQGLGRALLIAALGGFHQAGLRRAYLEVTAQNDPAIRLYRQLGFHKVRTVYKAVEAATATAR